MRILKLTLSIVLIMFFASCEKGARNIQNDLIQEEVSKKTDGGWEELPQEKDEYYYRVTFANELKNKLYGIGYELRNYSVTLASDEAQSFMTEYVSEIAFGSNTQPQAEFNNYYNHYSNNWEPYYGDIPYGDIDPELRMYVAYIEQYRIDSQSHTEFITNLDNLFQTAFYSNISSENKDQILHLIVSDIVATEWMVDHTDVITLYSTNGSGWWDSWGKCTAGIISGAGITAFAIGGQLAVGGAIVIPIVGAVPGAVVGAISGAILGGLGGAAAAC